MKSKATPRSTDDHLRPSLGKVLFRGFFILILVIVITWVGKFKENEPTAVRNHGLLGWHFNTDRGIAALVVFPDDNNDTNTV